MFTTLTNWLRPDSRKPRRLRALEQRLDALEDRVVMDNSFFALISANGTYSQDWQTDFNSWSDTAVTAIEGFNGSGLTSSAGADPRGISNPGGSTTLTTNLTDPSATSPTPGGIGEFELGSDRFVALAGDSGSNNAPYLLMHLDTRQTGDVSVSYVLRDEDKSSRNSVSQVALQFRVSPDGNFTGIPYQNVTGGFAPDATAGGTTKTTPVTYLLPAEVNDQEFVELRIITTNSASPGGTDTPDEWVGVDDIVVHGNVQPVIGLNGSTLKYIENSPITFIDPGMTLTDNDSTDFSGGQLKIDYTAVPTADDRILVNNQGTALGQISWTGSVSTGISIQYTNASATVTIGKANPNGGVAPTPLIIDFTSSAATQPAVLALLRNIGYLNASDDPVGGIRNVRFTISDGDSKTNQTSTPVIRPVEVVPVNDAPLMQIPGGNITIVENSPARVVDANITITDPDSHDYDGGTLIVSLPSGATTSDFLTIQDQGPGAGLVGVLAATNEVTYSGVVVGTFTGGDAGNPLLITFNASSNPTPLSVEAVARAIMFENTSDNPPVNPRLIKFTADDNDGFGQGGSQVTITIQPINDEPVVAPARAGFTYLENDAPTSIDALITMADPDSTDFNAGRIVVDYTSGGSVDDRLTIRNEGTGFQQVGVSGVAVSYNFGTGPVVVGTITGSGSGLTPLQVTFNPSATPQAVLAVLRNVSYSNVSDNPVTQTRTVRIVLSDGDGGFSDELTWVISVDSVNDGPAIGNVPVSQPYTAGFPAIVVAPLATVADPDNANFSTGNFTASIASGGKPGDILAIRNQGSGAGRIGLVNQNVTYGGVTIGSFSGGTAGAPLVVSLNASATPAAVQALADSITFRTPNGVGVIGIRTIAFSALDFTGGTPSNVPTVIVDVTSTAGPNDDFFEINEDAALFQTAGTITANDPNPGQLTVSTTPVVAPTKGVVTLGTDGSFQYVPNADANGTDKFTYRWTNTTTSATGDAVVTVVINPVNDAPVIEFSSSKVAVNEDSGSFSNANFAIPAGSVVFRPGPATATDEAGQTVVRTITNNNNALFAAQPTIDATGRLTFTPASNAAGTAVVTVAMQDSGGTFGNVADQDSAQYTFTIEVRGVNDAPSFQLLGTTYTASEDAGPQVVAGAAFNYQPGPGTAVDEAGQTPTYILTPIGTTGGLTFIADPVIDASGKLTFTAAPNSNGTASFIVQVQDSGGTAFGGNDLSSPRNFTIAIGAVNDPPTLGNDSASVIWNSDPNPLPVLANDSGNPDSGDTVTISATSQPSNGTVVVQPGGTGLTYQPVRGFTGTDTFTYTAVDSQGQVASATVTVEVIRYQTQPIDIVAVGSGVNGDSRIRLYDSKTGQFVGGFSAYAEFQGGVSVATADVNGDGVTDIIVGAGPGGGPHIQVVNGNRIGLLTNVDQIAPPSAMLGNFFGYAFDFRGGVTVASGDVNGDGKADIILGTGPGGAAHVRVISGAMIGAVGPDFQPLPQALLANFFAYDPSFRGGVQVATGDVNSDGYFDVLAAAGAGGASHIKAFSGRKLVEQGPNAPGVLLASFYGFDPNFRGGATVAAGDFNGDGYDDFIVGAGPGGGSHVKVFSPFDLATPIASFFAFEPGFNGGVNVGFRMRSGGATPLLLAGSGPGSPSRLATFAPPNFTTAGTVDIFADSFLGGVDVG